MNQRYKCGVFFQNREKSQNLVQYILFLKIYITENESINVNKS